MGTEWSLITYAGRYKKHYQSGLGLAGGAFCQAPKRQSYGAS